MRPGQQNNNNKRMRGRNRKGGGGGSNALTRSFESNGGDVKIRGTALHIAEKYVQLARDATSSGDRVAAENYMQHAEHYYRILAAAQAQMPQPQPIYRNDDDSDGDDDGDGSEVNGNGGNGYNGSDRQSGHQGGGQPVQYGQPNQQPAGTGEQPSIDPSDAQPYVNGAGQEQPFEGGGQQAEGRGEGREGGRGFRGRRRRPYRDRQGGEAGSDGASDSGRSEGGPVAAAAEQADD